MESIQIIAIIAKVTYIDSTYQVLAYKALNRDIADIWFDWALQMMENGYETEHLILLAGAGTSKPYNQFYLQDLTTKAFQELSLDWTSKERAISDYATYLIRGALAGKRSYRDVLLELKGLCVELDYAKYLLDFYSLYFALDDLEYSKHQGYWPDATRENIESIITAHFKQWINDQQE